MWSRLRRKTFAPRRPVLFSEQVALALVTAIVLAGSVVLVLYVVR
jgi:hypothetical protein